MNTANPIQKPIFRVAPAAPLWLIPRIFALALFGSLFGAAPFARAQAAPTTTTLILSSPSVPANTAVTLIATVAAGGIPVSPGLVIFQDGKTVLGSAQIVASSEIASIKVIPGLGAHQITANFAGTKAYAKSSSPAQTLTVTGQVAATTSISSSGSPGDYALTGTVTSSGPAPAGTVSFVDQTNNNPLGSATLGTASHTFQPQQTYGAGSFPDSVAIGDFNGDGIPDLVLANNFGSKNVSVLLGKGDGTFQAQQTYGVGFHPFSVAVGDFNQDGIPDLAVANQGDNTVSVLLGNGDGTFQMQQTFATGGSPFAVAVGDFNGDGIPDLVVANNSDANVGVLLGIGDGTFQAQQTYKVVGHPTSIAVGDLNGDGTPDLAVTNSSENSVSVLLGIGDGTFQPQQAYGTGSATVDTIAVAIGDFNGDSVPDLAVVNGGDNTVSVLLGKGDGTFQTPQTTYPTGVGPESLAVGDFNGDGIPDLAVANQGNGTANTVSVLLGIGDGTFQRQQTYGVGNAPGSVAVGDFNGDGLPDLATANSSSNNNVSVLLNSLTANATLNNVNVVGTGTHQVAASYGGDSNHQKSTSSSIPLTATQIMTSLSLMANQNTITAGQPVTLTASLSVYASGSLKTAGEAVTFYDGAAVLGMSMLNSQGQAIFTTSALPVGPNSISARYPGDANFTASTSNTVTVNVNPAAGFTITPIPPAEIVFRDRLGGVILKLQSVQGFNGNVTLSCSGGPAGSKCADLPQTAHVNGTAYAVSGVLFPNNTKPGTYTITFTGVSGSLTEKATAKFTVK